MRWFKHYADNHRGQSVQSLLDELGYFGPFFYYTIYEICAEKLEKIDGKELSKTSCEFRLHQRVVCSATRGKPTTVRRALDAGASCNLWSWELDGLYIKISIPILLNLLDREMKQPRRERGKSAAQTAARIDKDKDKDKEQEQEEEVVVVFETKVSREKESERSVNENGSTRNFDFQFHPDWIEIADYLKNTLGLNSSSFNSKIEPFLQTFGTKQELESFCENVVLKKTLKSPDINKHELRSYLFGAINHSIEEN